MRIVDPFLAVWPDVELDVTSAFQFRGLAALLGHEIDLLVTHDPVERLGPDYLRLLQAAGRGEVDIIVAESLNRLSRDQADTAPLFKRMSFFGDRLHTIADQDLDELKVGVGSLVSALYIKDIAQKNPPRLGGPCCLGQACRRQQPWISCKARDPRGWNGHHRAGSGTVEIAVGVGGTRRAPCPAAASQPVDPVPRAD